MARCLAGVRSKSAYTDRQISLCRRSAASQHGSLTEDDDAQPKVDEGPAVGEIATFRLFRIDKPCTYRGLWAGRRMWDANSQKALRDIWASDHAPDAAASNTNSAFVPNGPPWYARSSEGLRLESSQTDELDMYSQ
jgi:hypothetical protein